MSHCPLRLLPLCCLAACGLQAASHPAAAVESADSPPGPEVAAQPRPFRNGRFTLERGEVVAFLGGADVAAAQHRGHLEALLTVNFRGLDVRCRNFGWEGDTVFARPREVGFPPLAWHLKQARATVIVLQFGRSEALGGRAALPGLVAAYQKLLDECAQATPRLVLVTPPPFEKGDALRPDLSVRNGDLALFAGAIRELAHQRRLPLVDVFAELGGVAHRSPRLTDDGLQITPRGHAWIARAFARQLGFGRLARRAGKPEANGEWPDAGFERVRLAVVAKNRLWFDYWRPQNWAFLGGDRTNQPSSRDHRNPSLRWFPEEQEQFVPLIQQAEAQINQAVGHLPPE